MQCVSVTLLYSLLITGFINVAGARRVKKARTENVIQKHRQSKEESASWDDCASISNEVKAMWAAGAREWEGVYKCLHQTKDAIVFIECGMDTIDGERKAACWVRSKADDLQQFIHQVQSGIGGLTSAIAGWFPNDAAPVKAEEQEEAKNFFSTFMPSGPSQEELEAAIKKFAYDTDDPEAESRLTAELITSGKWASLNAFEKGFAVAVLKSAVTTTGTSALQVSEATGTEGENFFTFLLKLIAALLQSNSNNGRRAAANHYMGMNVGWDHVRRNMRADGWRW